MKTQFKNWHYRLFIYWLMVMLVPSMVMAQTRNPFPLATPESQGLDPAALDSLVRIVNGYFVHDEIVGAELLIIKNNHTVRHEAIGWEDREAQLPMQKNSIFNIRSMTKPITGAGIQLLIEAGKLKLDDKVANYLPGFKNEKSKHITIRQLLTHRSGLPLTILFEGKEYASLQEMANTIGEKGPQFDPNRKFWYSDAGTEVLGAITEVVTGQSLAEFRNQYLLQPLGMQQTFTLTSTDTVRRERLASLYVGSVNAWTRHWKSGDKSFYPFAWGSQSLYSTPLDYAAFLTMWLEQGKFQRKQILSEAAVKRTLTPVSRMTTLGSDMPYPAGFPDLCVKYGQLAMIHTNPQAADSTQPVIIGHSGSDGTFAWAWPAQNLMILYFTQSRGQATGLKLEAEIDRFVMHPRTRPKASAPIAEKYQPYLGQYTDRNVEYTVLVKNGKLAIDIPGQMVFELKDPDAEGLWYFALTNMTALSFEKDATGKVTALRIHQQTPMERKASLPDSMLQGVPGAFQPYPGKYLFAMLNREVTVFFKNSALFVDVPGQGTPELLPPDRRGRWQFKEVELAAVSFQQTDAGQVTGLTFYQAVPIPRGKNLVTVIEKVVKESGVAAAIQKYRELKTNSSGEYRFQGKALNTVGYNLLSHNQIEAAIEIFKLNVREYPNDFNVYDSLGEGYMKKGEKALAIQNYQKSLELNPNNENAKKMLQKIETGE